MCLKIFILNSPYITVNFQGVMVQLAPRVTIQQTNLGNQLMTLVSSKNLKIRADAHPWYKFTIIARRISLTCDCTPKVQFHNISKWQLLRMNWVSNFCEKIYMH